ncbi:MAG: hypothetical protein KDH88_09870 [Chromatiales bacterium]|nr:hypothetical protein [Chromatiales bacterium]
MSENSRTGIDNPAIADDSHDAAVSSGETDIGDDNDEPNPWWPAEDDGLPNLTLDWDR